MLWRLLLYKSLLLLLVLWRKEEKSSVAVSESFLAMNLGNEKNFGRRAMNFACFAFPCVFFRTRSSGSGSSGGSEQQLERGRSSSGSALLLNSNLEAAAANDNNSKQQVQQQQQPAALAAAGGGGVFSDRKPFVGGNWKCNGNPQLVSRLADLLNAVEGPVLSRVEVAVCPPAIYLEPLRKTLRRADQIRLCSQDISVKGDYGPYTGELCARMIKDFGVDWCVIGHSERRSGFFFPTTTEQQQQQPPPTPPPPHSYGETDAVVAEKIKSAVAGNLNIIACIGEKLADREKGIAEDVIERQLNAVLANFDTDAHERLVIAYEPVWAIGTGKAATPEMAQITHKFMRDVISHRISSTVAKNIRIIYGGSVNERNAPDLIKQDDIDGFLVGGASLNSAFVKILNEVDRIYSN